MGFIPFTPTGEDPRAGGQPQSRGDPDAFGAGIGRATQQLGGAIQQFGQSVASTFGGLGKKQAAERDALDTANALSNTFTPQFNEIVNNADPTGSDLMESTEAGFEEYKNGVLEEAKKKGASHNALTDIELGLARQKGSYLEGAAKNAAKMKGEDDVRSSGKGLDRLLNDITLHGATSKEDYARTVYGGDEIIASWSGKTANERMEATRAWHNRAGKARFDALIKAVRTPAQAKALTDELNTPYWKGELTPSDAQAEADQLAVQSDRWAELGIGTTADEHINNVLAKPETYMAEVKKGLDKIVAEPVSTPEEQVRKDAHILDYRSNMASSHFEGLAIKAKTPEDIEKLRKKAVSDEWRDEFTKEGLKNTLNSLNQHENAIDRDIKAKQDEIDKAHTKAYNLQRAQFTADIGDALAISNDGKLLTDKQFSALRNGHIALLRLSEDGVVPPELLSNMNKIYDQQITYRKNHNLPIPEIMRNKRAEAIAAEEDTAVVEEVPAADGKGKSKLVVTKATTEGKFVRNPTRGMMTLKKADPTADLGNVSAGLQDSIAAGATHLPEGYTVEATEGYSATGHRPKSQHKQKGRGAVDLYILHNGVRIPREGKDTTGMYGRLARYTLMEMRTRHPELASSLRWGGTFETYPGSGKADLMHFDLGGRGRGTTGAIGEAYPSRGGRGGGGVGGRGSSFEGALVQFESGWRNVWNTDETTKYGPAGGWFQIVTPTWERYGGLATGYKRAIDAPYAVQAEIAGKIRMGEWDSKTLDKLRAAGFKVDPDKTLKENIEANGGTLGTATEGGGGGGGDTSGGDTTAVATPAFDSSAYNRAEAYDKVIAKTTAALNADPIRHSIASGIISDTTLLGAGEDAWAQRKNDYATTDNYFGLGPKQHLPFTAEEAAAYTDLLNSDKSADQIALYKSIASWPAQMQKEAYAQLGETSPTGAAIGQLSADNAQLAMQGNKILKGVEAGKGGGAAWQTDANKGFLDTMGSSITGMNPNEIEGKHRVYDSIYAAKFGVQGEFSPEEYEHIIENVENVKFGTVNGVRVMNPKDVTGRVMEAALTGLDYTAVSLFKTPPKVWNAQHTELIDPTDVDKSLWQPKRIEPGLYIFTNSRGETVSTITSQGPRAYTAKLDAPTINLAATKATEAAAAERRGGPAGPVPAARQGSPTLQQYGQDIESEINAQPEAPPAPTDMPSLTPGVPGEGLEQSRANAAGGTRTTGDKKATEAPTTRAMQTPVDRVEQVPSSPTSELTKEEKQILNDSLDLYKQSLRSAGRSKEYIDKAAKDYMDYYLNRADFIRRATIIKRMQQSSP